MLTSFRTANLFHLSSLIIIPHILKDAKIGGENLFIIELNYNLAT